MVFEQILKLKNIVKHPEYSLFLGVLYSLLAFATSFLLFRNQVVQHFIGVSTILLTLVLAIPLIIKLFKYEENLELKKQGFFKKHKVVIDFFIYFFIGVFITFFVISLWMPDKIFSENQLYGVQPAVQRAAENQGLPPPPPISDWILIKAIFTNNLYVLVITFALSLFYGAGALFLIILNASIFASALSEVIRFKSLAFNFTSNYVFIGCNLGVMFFHMIPEVGSYLLAAIAGGVLSKAIIKEKFLSKNFFKILKNSAILLALGIIILLVAALIEVMVSRKLFLGNICLAKTEMTFMIGVVILMLIIALEIFRKKKFDYTKIYKLKRNK